MSKPDGPLPRSAEVLPSQVLGLIAKWRTELGYNKREWCEIHGINRSTLYRWDCQTTHVPAVRVLQMLNFYNTERAKRRIYEDRRARPNRV